MHSNSETRGWTSRSPARKIEDGVAGEGPQSAGPLSISVQSSLLFDGGKRATGAPAGDSAAVSGAARGCFFENGVGTTDGGGTFTHDNFSVG
jgi:hypothetical protein